jgi:hypothetical protein
MSKQQKPPANATNTGVHNDLDGVANADEFSEDEQLGFPPYWKAAVGKAFIGRVIALDDSDPEFERWIFEAQHVTKCQRGPAKEAKEVIVQQHEHFSTSAYGQFGDSASGRGLHKYVGEVVKLECTGEVDTGQPSPMFVFKLSVNKETKARLLAANRERTQRFLDAKAGSKAIAPAAPTA